MAKPPFFSVVMAAYNRGRHIRPSIESVLGQTFTDFELLVVGDGCRDATEKTVAEFASPKVFWRNLECNSGSQSAPNNEGLRHARGRWICYIGHDDVWAPDHLQRIRAVIAARRAVDFVVSGCIYHGPPESEIYYVTGLFEAPDAPLTHFFPPTALAHRRDVAERIGFWAEPRSIKEPVDVDFQLRAARAGLRFQSTGAVTVHKFAAGHRYLSYLRQTSGEQSTILRALQNGESSGWVEAIVERSKQAGMFMASHHGDHSQHEKGHAFEFNRSNKGLARATLQPLRGRTVIPQGDEPRGLDWYFRDAPGIAHRWSGPNPWPKILIPFTGGAVRTEIEVVTRPGASPAEVSVFVEREKIDCEVTANEGGSALAFSMRLKPSDYTIVTLHTPSMFRPADVFGNDDVRKLGIGVGTIVLQPE